MFTCVAREDCFDFEICVTTLAQHLTGHSNLSDAACIVTVSMRELFFWSSNVIEIKSAVCKFFEECFSKECRLKNRMFLSLKRLFFRFGPVTARYSHDLIAKKYAPVHRSDIAFDRSVLRIRYNCFSTMPGSAFCCFGAESSVL